MLTNIEADQLLTLTLDRLDRISGDDVHDSVVSEILHAVRSLARILQQERTKGPAEGAPPMTTPVLHTPECRKETIEREQARQAYLERWPHVCLACHGRGMYWYPGTDIEPGCWDECVCAGNCPRCAHVFPKPDLETDAYQDFIDGTPCPECGLDLTLTPMDLLPAEPDSFCACEEAAMLASGEEH